MNTWNRQNVNQTKSSYIFRLFLMFFLMNDEKHFVWYLWNTLLSLPVDVSFFYGHFRNEQKFCYLKKKHGKSQRNEISWKSMKPSTKNQNWTCDTRHYMKIANVFCPNVPFKCVFNKRQCFTNKCKNWRRHWSKSSNLMFISTSTTMKSINTFILWYWNTK